MNSTNNQTLAQERTQIFHDFFNNKIPSRMPVAPLIPQRLIAQHYGIDTIEYQYDYGRVSEASKELCEKLYSDAFPIFPPVRDPFRYQLLGSQTFQMSTTGLVQHPEVS